jgi:hypothetical protein
MKKPLKADKIAFLKASEQLFESLGFQPYPPDEPGYDRHMGARRIMTDYGVFKLHDHDSDSILFSLDIYGRFETPAVFGSYGDENHRRALALGISLPSGKWNVNGGPANGQAVLAEFERRMRSVNARPPTPDEQAAWDAQDAAETARLSIQRKEWRNELEARKPLIA